MTQSDNEYPSVYNQLRSNKIIFTLSIALLTIILCALIGVITKRLIIQENDEHIQSNTAVITEMASISTFAFEKLAQCLRLSEKWQGTPNANSTDNASNLTTQAQLDQMRERLQSIFNVFTEEPVSAL